MADRCEERDVVAIIKDAERLTALARELQQLLVRVAFHMSHHCFKRISRRRVTSIRRHTSR